MQPDRFEQIIEKTALTFYQEYQHAKDVFQFLNAKLPTKYGLKKGFLFNNKKELSAENNILYQRLSCPILPTNETKTSFLIPANFAYGNLSFLPEINQSSLAKQIAQNEEFYHIYQNQTREAGNEIKPLTIWLATDLAPFISLNDLEDRLLAEQYPPDIVAILNQGLLVTLNEQTIQTIFAFHQKVNPQSFDKQITTDLLDITQKTLPHTYFKMAASASYKNCFSFYILLLELLKNQSLPNGDNTAELAAIW